MKRFIALYASLAFSTASAQVSLPEVTKRIDTAGNSVIAYLPDLQNMPLAQSLKQAAQRNLPVTLLTGRKAHMIQGSYLLSIALSNAQTPPKPLKYAFVNLNSPPSSSLTAPPSTTALASSRASAPSRRAQPPSPSRA
ncbi:hypothetical protein [Deinococcus sp. SL84]|uniref:hypothetical protein n=1 Tax=Deinococcus sp. SL84 TaxID=2994663 RepID=UPI002274D8EB|nr:hypothetical protein [Deinococcus sp. SL84]MCY1703881.1 hypothetical protein [Deinococcus sp. SL84]